MKVHFTERGWEDYVEWARDDPAMLDRLNRIIEEARLSPFSGVGKPEPLKQSLSGWWSRRITNEHRLIYRVAGRHDIDQRLEIAGCRHHYSNR